MINDYQCSKGLVLRSTKMITLLNLRTKRRSYKQKIVQLFRNHESNSLNILNLVTQSKFNDVPRNVVPNFIVFVYVKGDYKAIESAQESSSKISSIMACPECCKKNLYCRGY